VAKQKRVDKQNHSLSAKNRPYLRPETAFLYASDSDLIFSWQKTRLFLSEQAIQFNEIKRKIALTKAT